MTLVRGPVPALRAPAPPAWWDAEGTIHVSGVQAVARTLFDVLRADRARGLRTAAFVSGYQGSPLAGFDLQLQRALPRLAGVEVVHRPAVNEELAATAVMGSQLAATMPSARHDGVLGVWYGKAPGVDRAADALRHASWAGAGRHGGAVAFVGDDPSAKSSTLPSASERILADLGMPVLFPSNLGEVTELGRHAVALSRWSGAWVACKLVTSVADGQGTLTVEPVDVVEPDGWEPPPVTGDLLTPTTIAREADVAERRIAAAARYGDANGLNRLTVDPDRAALTIVAAGTVHSEVLEALRLLGLDERRLAGLGVRLAQVRMSYPLGPRFLERLSRHTGEIVVVEERRDLVEAQVLAGVARRPGRPAVTGRHDEEGRPFIPGAGTLGRSGLARLLQPRLAAHFGDLIPAAPRERITIPVAAPAGGRVPWFCAGCPHSTSTQVPAGTLVGAGIGCHAIVAFMPERRVGRIAGITQMGGEGAQWIGLAPFVGERHLVQNLGDGTFFHSGHLAVRAAVAAGVPITFKVLWNGASAMTGGQAVTGAAASPLALAELLVLEGVRRVVVTTDEPSRHRRRPRGPIEVRHRAEIVAVQEELAAIDGVTVLIHDQACATELRRSRKRGTAPRPGHAVVINERVCEGCGDCQTKSNCLALQTVPTPFGPKTRIDADSCNVDLSCLAGDCPAFALVDVASLSPPEVVLPPDVADLPAPPRADLARAIRIAGIGGTGVVTTAHLLVRAALLEGLEAAGLDQTGLSQKAGAVVSDVRLGPESARRSNLLGEGEADVLIAADLLAAARPAVLAATGRARTSLVASRSAALSGPMVLGEIDRRVPVEEAAAAVAAACRPDAAFADADAIARHTAGTAAAANVVLLGIAAQRGLLPMGVESLEAAIVHNGVAVDENLAAFRAGRAWAAGRAPLAHRERAAGTERRPGWTGGPEALTAGRHAGEAAGSARPERAALAPEALAADLERYQSGRLAERFRALVAETRAAESAAGGDGTLTAAVAAGYHKLLAYKDEYEVARLLLDHPAADGRLTWLLHPPLLRSLGLRRKLRLGPWATPFLRALRAGRHLRGTPLDPFGHTALRRTERRLPDEYAAAIRAVLARLEPATLPAALELARLPDMVRGFESVKEASIDAYRRKLTGLSPLVEAHPDVPLPNRRS